MKPSKIPITMAQDALRIQRANEVKRTPKSSKSIVRSTSSQNKHKETHKIVCQKSASSTTGMPLTNFSACEGVTSGNHMERDKDDIAKRVRDLPRGWQLLVAKLISSRDSLVTQLHTKRLMVQADNFIKITRQYLGQTNSVQLATDEKTQQLLDDLELIFSECRKIEEENKLLKHTQNSLKFKITSLNIKLRAANTTLKSVKSTSDSEKRDLMAMCETLRVKSTNLKSDLENQISKKDAELAKALAKLESSKEEIRNAVGSARAYGRTDHSKSNGGNPGLPNKSSSDLYAQSSLGSELKLDPSEEIEHLSHRVTELEDTLQYMRSENANLRVLVSENAGKEEQLRLRLQNIFKRNTKDARTLTNIVGLMQKHYEQARHEARSKVCSK